MSMFKPIADRIMDLTSIVPVTGCWMWLGRIDSSGYASMKVGGSTVGAHRVSYAEFVGGIADGLTIDHLCRNTWCVNPAHLEPVPMRVNIMRGGGVGAVNSRKTHCSRGHELAGVNIYLEWRGHGRDQRRHCLVCRKLRAANKYSGGLK